jgi:hypothetical protein
LGNVENVPQPGNLTPAEQEIVALGSDAIHRLAQQYLLLGKLEDAWRVLLQLSS